MRIKFYPKRTDAGSETSVYILVNYGGKSLKIYPGLSINPKYWNHKKQQARNLEGFNESAEFNQRINKIRSTFNEVYLNFINTNEGAAPSPELLRTLLEESLKRKKIRINFIDFFEDFANRTKEGRRINPGKQKPIKGTGGRGYFTTLNHLKNFALVKNFRIDFDTIDLRFYSEFTKYLSEVSGKEIKSHGSRNGYFKKQSLSLNTVGSHIQRIKAVMNDAVDKKLTKNLEFKNKNFAKVSEESDSVYLDQAELKDLQDLDLTDTRSLDITRDIFLIGCYTGLRVSDYKRLKSQHIKDGFIEIEMTKGERPVVIPVHSVVDGILRKYNGDTPPQKHENVINRDIKIICKKIPALQETVSKEITRNGIKVITQYQKWELVASHTARRSFATNEYLAGTPTITIMAITGHKTEKAFLKYIKVTPTEHARLIKMLWDRREGKLKAV